MQYTNNVEELRKAITAISIAGDRVVMLDNISGVFGNSTLDSALTSEIWSDRVLGLNTIYEGPLQIVWLGTGNNVHLGAEIPRRICPIRIDCPEEKPEFKTEFRYPNLREHVRSRRAELLSAAITIVRAWIYAGMPRHNLPVWGSFEGWSGVVREAIVYAGLRILSQLNSN